MYAAIRRSSLNFLPFFLFLYFFTLHADQLAIEIAGIHFRFNNFVALFLTASYLFAFRSSLFFLEKKLTYLLLLILGSALISLCNSDFPLRCFLFLGWFGFTFLCYFYLPFSLISSLEEKFVLRLYFFSFLLVGLYAFLQLILSFFGFLDPFAEQILHSFIRPNAFAYEPSYYALYMSSFVMTANMYYLLGKNREFIFAKLNWILLFFINFLYLISTSMGALVSYLIFFTVAFFFSCIPSIRLHYPSLFRKCLKGFIFFTAIPLFSLLLFPHVLAKLFLHHSFVERWQGIKMAVKVFTEHPFFGVGLGAYPSYLCHKWQKGEINFLIPTDVSVLTNPLKVFEPSNVSTEVLASIGFIGFGMICLFFLQYFRYAKQALFKENIPSDTKDLCYALLISLITTLVIFQFSQGFFRTYIWVYLGLTLGLFRKIILKTSF